MFLLCEEGSSQFFPCFLQITKAVYSQKGKSCRKNDFTRKPRDILTVVLWFTPATFSICVYRKMKISKIKKEGTVNLFKAVSQ